MQVSENKKKLSYFKELDGVRAIAILMVMFFHFFSDLHTADGFLLKIKEVAMWGETGVTLFFVLSGFLITRILLFTKGSPHYFSNFFVRRSLRIFPLYYLFLVIFYLMPWFFGGNFTSFGEQIYYWLYLQGFATVFSWKSDGPGQFWSLAVEEHFYLVWPFLIYYFRQRRVLLWIFAIIIIAFVLRLYMDGRYPQAHHFTFTRMDDLAIGALLALLEAHGYIKKGNAIYFLGMLIPLHLLWLIHPYLSPAIVSSLSFLQMGLTYMCIIGGLICLPDRQILKKWLTQAPLLFTGKISYGLYVFHPLCFKLFEIFFTTQYWMLNLLGSLGFSYLIAALSYYWFESYFLKLKTHFSK